MFCTKCGAQLPENAAFCTSCGAAVGGETQQQTEAQQTQQTAPTQPVYDAYAQSVDTAEMDEKAQDVLTWGILGLVFSEIFPLLGIIFSSIGKRKAADFTNLFGEPTGKAKVGAILAKVGFILGWVATGLIIGFFCLYGAILGAVLGSM